MAIALSTLVNSHFLGNNQSSVHHIDFVSKLCTDSVFDRSNATTVFEQAVQSLDKEGIKTLAFGLFFDMPKEKKEQVLSIVLDDTLPGAGLLFHEYAKFVTPELYTRYRAEQEADKRLRAAQEEIARLREEIANLRQQNQNALNQGVAFGTQQSFEAGGQGRGGGR